MLYSYHLQDARVVSQEECKRVPSYCCIKQFYRCHNWLRKVFEDQQNCARQKNPFREAYERGSTLASCLQKKMKNSTGEFDESSRQLFSHISIRGLLLPSFKQNERVT